MVFGERSRWRLWLMLAVTRRYRMNIKWLYERDYKRGELFRIANYWLECGYRVFVQGYSAMECEEWGGSNAA